MVLASVEEFCMQSIKYDSNRANCQIEVMTNRPEPAPYLGANPGPILRSIVLKTVPKQQIDMLIEHHPIVPEPVHHSTVYSGPLPMLGNAEN